MQVNCEELELSHSRWQADQSGSLQVQVCKDAKLRKDFASCFCRLRGNLLFISRGIDPMQQECEYLVVLEACKVEVDFASTEATGGCVFRLVFDHESQTILLRAASEADRAAWVAAIQEASIFDKIAEAEVLRQEIAAVTGQDPLQPGAAVADNDAADDAADGASGLELHLACRRLPALASGEKFPNAQLEVYVRTPPVDDWSFVGRTDVVDNCAGPAFRKLVLVPDSHYSELSDFRFDLFDVRDQSTRTVRQLLTVQASAKQLAAANELLLLQAAAEEPELMPAVIVTAVCRSGNELGRHKGRHMQLLRHVCNNDQQRVASHSYKFESEAGGAISVREYLCDLKCGVHLPLQLSRIEHSRLATLVSVVGDLGEQKCPRAELQRLYSLRPAEAELRNGLKALCQEAKACVDETNRRLFDGEYLKLSRLRAVPELAFVPPNLQLHRTALLDSKEKVVDFHDVVTMGAPSAHHLKFKKGGLLGCFRACAGAEEAVRLCQQIGALLHSGGRLTEQIAALLAGLRSQMRSQQSLVAATDCERLSELATELICLASNCLVVQARVEMDIGSVRLQNLNTRLQFVLATAAPKDGNKPDVAVLNSACEDLVTEVRHTWRQCQLTLGRLWLSEGAKPGGEILLTALRRRMSSHSQLLTACVCGVLSHFSRWSEAAWRQMATCGVPVFFESLLSAYKSECGMLEDAAACAPLLQQLHLQFFPGNSGDLPIIEEPTRVRICVPSRVWDRLGGSVQSLLATGWFEVKPLLFNVGINEQQTLAEKKRLASLGVQRDVNRHSALALRALVDKVIRHRAASAAGAADGRQFADDADSDSSVEQALRDKLQALELHVEEDKSKPVGLLQVAEEICWLLDGVRVTNCKSGKDRTAMALTLEQARWLRDRHGLRAERSSFESTLGFLREHGLRRKNCFRNIGTTFYAFNRVQLHTFPQQYRPPKGTYQRGPT